MSTALSMPLAEITAAPLQLNSRQKAAIIVRLLVADGAEFSLRDLSGSQQADLIHQMADMSHVDQSTMMSVVEEFMGHFSGAGLSFPGALEGSLALMEKSVSAETTRRIRRQAGLALHPDPWA